MPKNSTQKLKVPASPKVHHRKSVAKCMGRESYASDTNSFAQASKIPLKVPDGNLGIALCTKNVALVMFAPNIAEQELTQIGTKGYKAMSVPLPQNFEDEIIKVTIFFRKSENLRSSKSRVQNGKRHKVSPNEVDTGRFERDGSSHVVC
jgi:hypothetical protein